VTPNARTEELNGMAELHPQARALLADAATLPPLHTLTIDQARARKRAPLGTGSGPIADVRDFAIGDGEGALPVRSYHPRPGIVLPILVFFHGGGWILNDLDTHDVLCRELALAAHCVVLSVDYRRSPEYKYPAAIEDARSALAWASANAGVIGGDAARLAVGGDSAGGAIAAGMAKLVRDEGGPRILAQLLLYPVADYPDPARKSYVERGSGYSIDHDFMRWIWAAYLPEDWRRDDPYLFPLQGDLRGSPTSIICTAEYDVLRDEGMDYADNLRAAGVSVQYMNANDQMHGFASHTEANDSAADLVRDAGRRLRQVLETDVRQT